MTIHDYIFVFVPVDCKQNLPEILDLIDITFMTFLKIIINNISIRIHGAIAV